MIGNLLELFKYPVTTVIGKANEEGLKKGAIRTIIISFAMALVGILYTVISIFQKYSTTSKSYYASYYSSEELVKMRDKALEGTFEVFFRSFITFIIAIAVIAFILFIISRLVKSPLNYTSTLSMTSNALLFYTIGVILNLVFSFVYTPIGWLILYATILYSSLTLMNAFRDSLDIESTDKLVIVTTGVLVAIVVVLVVVLSSLSGVSLKDFTNAMDFLGV